MGSPDDRPDPVEVVAEAIHLAREIRDPTGWDPDAGSDGQGGVPGAAYVAPWDELGSADRRDYREQAEAALAALCSRGLLPEPVEAGEWFECANGHRFAVVGEEPRGCARCLTSTFSRIEPVEGQNLSINPSCEPVETAVGGSTRGTPPDIGAGTGRAAVTAAGPGRDVGGRPGHRSRQVPEPLEGEAERLRAAGDRMAREIEQRWTGPSGCECCVCSAARAWRALSSGPEDR